MLNLTRRATTTVSHVTDPYIHGASASNNKWIFAKPLSGGGGDLGCVGEDQAFRWPSEAGRAPSSNGAGDIWIAEFRIWSCRFWRPLGTSYVPAYVCSRLFARSYPYVKIDVKAERLPLLTVN